MKNNLLKRAALFSLATVMVCTPVLAEEAAGKASETVEEEAAEDTQETAEKQEETEAEASKQEADKSETDKQEADESEADKQEADESETDKQEADESEADKQEADDSETDKQEVTESETDEQEEETPEYDGNLIIKDGLLEPMCNFSDMRDPYYTNEGSDILRFCVYVETDNDTDNDGMADLVKALVQVPRSAAEGKYKAGTIYDPTPYGAGMIDDRESKEYYVEEPFDYESLYRDCKKREPEGEMTSLEVASYADPSKDWNYTVPQNEGATGMGYADVYDYYLVRGYAVVTASGIGTYGSEGFELCGTPLERDSHKAVVEWLAGNRRAFVSKDSDIEIKADWSNGKVAMTGVSYGGTLSFEVATTGVEGLVTVIPVAGIANWYDYTNSQGAATIFSVNYTDTLAFINCGACFEDIDWTVLNREYGSWLWQISRDQEATNGNYAEIWEETDYRKDWKNIKCSAIVIQGLNDFNVQTRHADNMVQAFTKAGANVKLVLHQDGHNDIENTIVNGERWNITINRWLAHYLYDVDNGAEDMPAVLAQSNVDGSWKTYDTWRDFEYSEIPVQYEKESTAVTSEGLAEYTTHWMEEHNTELSKVEKRDDFYMNLDESLAAVYPLDMPEGSTIYGVPEIHVKMKTDKTDYDGLMITAVLVDTMKDGSFFDAYMTKNLAQDNLPKKIIGDYEGPGSWNSTDIVEYVQDATRCKAMTYGWTDLTNPGCGYDPAEYTETADLEEDKYYDYTFYMLPTVYTVQPGHQLNLVLMTWDPYQAFLDESFEGLDMEKSSEEIDYDYSFRIDNESLKVMMPLK